MEPLGPVLMIRIVGLPKTAPKLLQRSCRDPRLCLRSKARGPCGAIIMLLTQYQPCEPQNLRALEGKLQICLLSVGRLEGSSKGIELFLDGSAVVASEVPRTE